MPTRISRRSAPTVGRNGVSRSERRSKVAGRPADARHGARDHRCAGTATFRRGVHLPRAPADGGARHQRGARRGRHRFVGLTLTADLEADAGYVDTGRAPDHSTSLGDLEANVDPASFTDIDLFEECLVDGFGEVVALGGCVVRARDSRGQPSAAPARRILDDDHTAASPLILGSAARLLAATALAVFPNNLLPEHGLTAHGGDGRTSPDTVRRAEEFLHAHAHLDIDLTDIAAACLVTPRALQYAFARHHDTSPMRYLRRVRLARAHQDLLDADPAGPVTVTAVAARWGFAHPGRFAAAYRRAYGQTPRTTLRT